MRLKDLASRFSGFTDAGGAACALTFLHELSAQETVGQPPRDARWQRLIEHAGPDLGAAVDRACAACLETWPDQLAGFFCDVRFAGTRPQTLVSAMKAVEQMATAQRPGSGRYTVLGDVFQELRGLGTKQMLGAFFTPWNVALMMAQMSLAVEEAQELWVCEPCVGAGVLLVAALEVYRGQFGPAAARAMTMIGVDLDARACAIARASLLIAGADPRQFWIFAGDSLAQPIVGRDRTDGQLKELAFPIVLANPPFGSKTSTADLERAAERGPLVVPDEVLYRHVPRVAAIASQGQSARSTAPVVPAVAAAETGEAATEQRAAGGLGDEPSGDSQLTLPFDG